MIYTMDELRAIIKPIAQKYALPAVYLFGSYARGTATENSDIDLIVDTAGTSLTSLFSLGALYCDLEQAFQKKVDLITMNSLTQEAQMPCERDFQETVFKESVCIYIAA